MNKGAEKNAVHKNRCQMEGIAFLNHLWRAGVKWVKYCSKYLNINTSRSYLFGYKCPMAPHNCCPTKAPGSLFVHLINCLFVWVKYKIIKAFRALDLMLSLAWWPVSKGIFQPSLFQFKWCVYGAYSENYHKLTEIQQTSSETVIQLRSAGWFLGLQGKYN